MDTTAHIVCNLLVQSRPSYPRIFIWTIVGAILPDLPIFVFYAWESGIVGSSESEIWSTRYFLPGWQNFIDLFNSIPLVILALAASIYFRLQWGVVVTVGMLLHIAFDIPLHHDDAHRHFFPISNWRFFSPFSYWDSRFYGDILRPAQVVFVFGGLIWLWMRHPGRSVKVCVLLLALTYIIYQVFAYLAWGGN